MATKAVADVVREMREEIKVLSERLAVLEAGALTKPTKKRASPSDKQEPSSVSKIRDAFRQSYLETHGTPYPGWGAKENSQIAHWIRSISEEQALRYATIYPRWDKPWIVSRGHRLADLIMNYVELDAWLNRHDAHLSKVVGSKVREKFLITKVTEQQEVVEHAKRAANPDHLPTSIGYDHKVQIQTRSELHRTLNERAPGSHRENASKRDDLLLQDCALGDPEEV